MTFPVFASGDVLQASDMNAVGMWLVKTQTIGSGVTSVAVTSAFSSDYDTYKIIVSGGVAAGAAAVGLQLGASTTGYFGTLIFSAYSSAAGLFLTDDNATKFTYAGVANTGGICLNVDLTNPGRADRTFIQGLYANPSTTGEAGRYQAFHNSATAFTDFTISCGQALTGGNIKVYGFRN